MSNSIVVACVCILCTLPYFWFIKYSSFYRRWLNSCVESDVRFAPSVWVYSQAALISVVSSLLIIAPLIALFKNVGVIDAHFFQISHFIEVAFKAGLVVSVTALAFSIDKIRRKYFALLLLTLGTTGMLAFNTFPLGLVPCKEKQILAELNLMLESFPLRIETIEIFCNKGTSTAQAHYNGFNSPKISIDETQFVQLTPRQREAILTHEIGHLTSTDGRISLAIALVTLAMFLSLLIFRPDIQPKTAIDRLLACGFASSVACIVFMFSSLANQVRSANFEACADVFAQMYGYGPELSAMHRMSIANSPSPFFRTTVIYDRAPQTLQYLSEAPGASKDADSFWFRRRSECGVAKK
jgi:Zn-dependent protease with chaperone function